MSSESLYMSNVQDSDGEEANLRELAAAILSGWRYIAVSCAVCVSLSALYVVNVKPTFEARAVFELKSPGGGPSISSEYAGIASMAGISLGDKKSKGVFDRLVGRDFIIRLSRDVSLEDDYFFNPPKSEATLLSLDNIKSLLSSGVNGDDQIDPFDSIRAAYIEAVSVSETKNGSIQVSVTHNDASRAAVIANAIVSRLVKELSEEEKQTQREQLTYLSDQLADALAEMEATKKSVADFALTNSLSSPSAFATRSELMFDLREQLRRTQEMALAVKELSSVMSSESSLTQDDYEKLRLSSPIIDDVDFRRLIGVPEALDAWLWPPKERLGGFSSTLTDRIARIQRSIDDLMEEAELYASSTEQLAGLQREATVAEATYNVLIEQVKAQSLIAGYQGKVASFYQSATPPNRATSPKKKLVVALALVLGLMVGAMISFVSAFRGGKLYTASSIFEASGASMFFKTKSFRKSLPHDAVSFARVMSSLSDAGLIELQIAQSMHPSKAVVLCATAPTLPSLSVGLWMALLHNKASKKVALLTLGEKLPSFLQNISRSIGDYMDVIDFEGIDIIIPKNAAMAGSALTSPELHELIAQQDTRYDVVVVCASSEHASNVVRAFARYNPFVVVLSKAGATLRGVLDGIRSVIAPQSVVSMSE